MLCCAKNRRCGSSRVTSPYKSWINCSRVLTIKRRVVMPFSDLTLYSLTHFFISFFSEKFT